MYYYLYNTFIKFSFLTVNSINFIVQIIKTLVIYTIHSIQYLHVCVHANIAVYSWPAGTESAAAVFYNPL
jgi:hypothetical protein